VHDPRPRSPHRPRNLLRTQPAAQHPRRRLAAAEQSRIALEQLGILAEVLAHQPEKILYGALLAAAAAVPIVQEEDHYRPKLERPAQRGCVREAVRACTHAGQRF
jgi:hypothetical protein